MNRRGVLVVVAALAVLASACSPSPASTSPSPVATQASATDGPFTLMFVVPRTDWQATESIDGTATLSVTSEVDVGGSGEGLIGFDYDEIGGESRHVVAAWTLDCVRYALMSDRPWSSKLIKSGGYDPAASGADFLESFFADPAVHLPAGDWTITAIASFTSYDAAQSCHQPTFEIKAPVTIHVRP